MNVILRERFNFSKFVFQLVQGDITEEIVEAIVNAANSRLQHGGGLAGVISRKGGPIIQKESDAWVQNHGPLSHGEPAVTTGGNLACKFIIHAVGPIWGSGDEDRKLAAAVTGSLKKCDAMRLKSIAIPAISTGIFGFPVDRAAEIIISAVQTYLNDNHKSGIKVIRLVLFDPSTVSSFVNVWDNLDLPPLKAIGDISDHNFLLL